MNKNKYVLFFLILMMGSSVLSQNIQPTSPQDMQKIMRQMIIMQDCLSKIDRSVIETFKQNNQVIQNKIDRLCAQGNKKEAAAIAQGFAQKMMEQPTIKAINQCTKFFQGAENFLETSDFFQVKEHITQENVCSSNDS